MLSKVVLPLALCASVAVAQSAVSQDVFDKIVRYSTFAAAAYSDDCLTPPYGSQIVKLFNDTNTDTQGYLFRAGGESILSFRGSATPRDLDTDFAFSQVDQKLPGVSCAGCKVHEGFQQAYISISSAIEQELASVSSLTVTGHSLGGAVASLAATSLVSKGKRVTVYTYGEPRNGDAAFSSYVDGRISDYYRVTHNNDGIPQIPPTVLGYRHHGTEYWQREKTGITAANTLRCPGSEPTNCNARADPGQNPINGAHIAYSNQLTASALFNSGCGFKFP